MTINILSEKLADLMEKETDLIETISAEEQLLQKTLTEKNWSEMEKVICRLSPLSAKVEKIESDREKVFNTLMDACGKKESEGFYAVAMYMEGDVKERCMASYRKLKVSLLKVQSITGSIDQYVKNVGNTTQKILSEIFPYRKGSIYSSRGGTRPVHSDPMVFNRHF